MGLELAAISAGVGIASTAAGSIASFAQAGKQKRLQMEAEAKAKEMIDEARKKLDVNFFDELGINKEPYELQREALLQSGAGALQAAVEGDMRGAAATAGRVQLAQNQKQEEIRAAMAGDLAKLEEMSAAEDSRLRDERAKLDLGEALGAQVAASDAEARRNKALQQGFQGAISTVQQGLAAMPLYTMDNKAAQAALGDLGVAVVPDMSPSEFRKWKRSLTAQEKDQLFGNENFQKAYEQNMQGGFNMNPFFYDFMKQGE